MHGGPSEMLHDFQHGENREEQYELLRPIGSGSFGQVFLVLHRMEQKEYVMKTIPLGATMDEKGRLATELEVRLLSEMQHPNIVAYRESFVNREGCLCIFMEYCEVGDVYTYTQELRKAHQMPAELRLLEWFIQIVLALHALHLKKILHRDLKTQNIFLTGNRATCVFALKLGDLGIATVLSSTTDLAQTQIGTPFYMSPELINNKPYSYKSDIWGLGCVLYEIVNGQRAFDAQSLNGLALKIIKGNYTPCTANCSQETKSLIKSMLSKNPTHRPTLKEILHVSSIRPHIPQTLTSVLTAAPLEAKLATEQVLTEQLKAVGLGGLVNAPGRPKDRRHLQQKLERAVTRKRREEEMLQQTANLLAECLHDPPVAADPLLYPPELAEEPHLGQDDGGTVDSLCYGPKAPVDSGADPWAEHGVQPQDADSYVEDTMLPAMSCRDRVLLEKERRKEEEQVRFEQEARKIREENLSHQRDNRIRLRDSRHAHASHGASDGVSDAPTVPAPLGRPRAQTEDTVGGVAANQPLEVAPGHCTSVSWLLDYQHIEPANLDNPFQSCHPTVVHSSRRGHRGRAATQQPREAMHHTASRVDEPSPPPLPRYGEPAPPHNAPPAGQASMWSSWRTTDAPQHHSRPLHLKALSAADTQRPQPPEHSDLDSNTCSGSVSEVDEGSVFSDGGSASVFSGDGLQPHRKEQRARRRKSTALQQRIDRCQSAIHRHRMTIEMLQYNSAQVPMEAGGGQEPMEAGGGLAPHPAHPPSDAYGIDRPRAPAIIQDSVARLVRRCLEGLGSEKFQQARRYLQFSLDNAEVPSSVRLRMIELLGLEKIGFLSLIDQVVHMERRWGAAQVH